MAKIHPETSDPLQKIQLSFGKEILMAWMFANPLDESAYALICKTERPLYQDARENINNYFTLSEKAGVTIFIAFLIAKEKPRSEIIVDASTLILQLSELTEADLLSNLNIALSQEHLLFMSDRSRGLPTPGNPGLIAAFIRVIIFTTNEIFKNSDLNIPPYLLKTVEATVTFLLLKAFYLFDSRAAMEQKDLFTSTFLQAFGYAQTYAIFKANCLGVEARQLVRDGRLNDQGRAQEHLGLNPWIVKACMGDKDEGINEKIFCQHGEKPKIELNDDICDATLYCLLANILESIACGTNPTFGKKSATLLNLEKANVFGQYLLDNAIKQLAESCTPQTKTAARPPTLFAPRSTAATKSADVFETLIPYVERQKEHFMEAMGMAKHSTMAPS